MIRGERKEVTSEDMKMAEKQEAQVSKTNHFLLLPVTSSIYPPCMDPLGCDVVAMLTCSLRGTEAVVWLQVNRNKLCAEEPGREFKPVPC